MAARGSFVRLNQPKPIGSFGADLATLPEDKEAAGIPVWAWVLGGVIAIGVIFTAIKTR